MTLTTSPTLPRNGSTRTTTRSGCGERRRPPPDRAARRTRRTSDPPSGSLLRGRTNLLAAKAHARATVHLPEEADQPHQADLAAELDLRERRRRERHRDHRVTPVIVRHRQ